tara:strand:- start:144 stop:626 length:483 start_codon:yes stop_codon:yes gene_type:complete
MSYKLTSIDNIDVKEDPVRPELTVEFRTSEGRKIYALINDNGERAATICVAFTKAVPTNVRELDKFTDADGHIAVAYTVWSKERGAGRLIVNQLIAHARKQDQITRVVTLSPLTDMARRFHLRNGAVELQVNKETQNFEYEIEKDSFWLKQLKKIREKVL